MANGSITLAQVAAHPGRAIASPRSTGAGWYRLDTLIARDGPISVFPEPLRLLSGDCPKRPFRKDACAAAFHRPSSDVVALLRDGRLS